MGALAKLMLTTTVMAGLSSAAQCADLQAFQPAGKWVANGEDGRCTLARDFAGAGVNLALEIEPLPLSSYVVLTFKGAGGAGPYTRSSARISFDQNRHSVERDAEIFDTLDKSQHVLRLRFLRADLDNAAATGTIAIVANKYMKASISIPQLAAGLHILDRCEQTIIENVGLTTAQISAIAHNAQSPDLLFRFGVTILKLLMRAISKMNLLSDILLTLTVKPPIVASFIRRTTKGSTMAPVHIWMILLSSSQRKTMMEMR